MIRVAHIERVADMRIALCIKGNAAGPGTSWRTEAGTAPGFAATSEDALSLAGAKRSIFERLDATAVSSVEGAGAKTRVVNAVAVLSRISISITHMHAVDTRTWRNERRGEAGH